VLPDIGPEIFRQMHLLKNFQIKTDKKSFHCDRFCHDPAVFFY